MSERPLTFVDAGRFEIYCHHSLPADYPEEVHETVQVCVPLGRALYRVTRQSETGRTIAQDLGARDVLVLPIGQPHGVVWHRSADIVSFQFSESFITQALGVPALRLQDAVTLRDPFISQAAARLRDSLGEGGVPSRAFAEAIATVIAYRIGLVAATAGAGIWAQKHVTPLSATQLACIESYIEERLDQPIGLSEIADRMGLSMWHFMRRFTASHGLSPHAFITQRRLARAQNLLAKSNLSITEISLEVGMSHSHFSRTFLAQFGLSPREFRQQR
jgi:AraC family transcriptional regulator